jgi:hypothetical protein
MSAEPTLVEIIRTAISSRLMDLHVALPGRVESYDETTQTAEVLPMIRRAIPDELGEIQHEALPKIPNVPILFPRGSGDSFSLTWPLASGDFVLLVFNSWATGQWRETGDVSDPVDLRKHGLGSPVAIPGIAPKTGSIPTDPAAMVVEGSEVKVGASATSYVALNDLVMAELTAISALLPGYTPPAAAPFVGSSKLKAE